MSWIPVREQYPDNETPVLYTVRDKKTGQHFVEMGCYFAHVDGETGEITNIYTANDILYSGQDSRYEVLAWDYVPKPYREFKVIVAGSRTFKDYDLLEMKLDYIFIGHKPTSIVCGCAAGADQLGKEYAMKHGIPVDEFPADWENEGKSAGYKRNERMADAADALVAFHDGKSSGTKNMIDIAKKKGLQVRVINF